MPIAKLRDGENFEVLIRRFKRSCEKAGIVAEYKRKEFYEKPTTVRKREKDASIKRFKKKNSRNVLRRKGTR